MRKTGLDATQLRDIANTVILAHSADATDEAAKDSYILIMSEWITAFDILATQNDSDVDELFHYLSEMYRQFSLCRSKARALLFYTIISAILWNGTTTTDNTLRGCYQINDKKMRNIQNFDGRYKGVGKDTHVTRVCCSVYLVYYPNATKGEQEQFAKYACTKMTSNPGVYCNEICGEFGQILNRGTESSREFQKKVFEDLSQNHQYKEIIQNWKEIINKNQTKSHHDDQEERADEENQ